MATQTVSSEPLMLRDEVSPESSRRIGFRFAVVYFGLYCFFTQILISLIPIPNATGLPTDLSQVPPLRWLVLWNAKHVFRAATALKLRRHRMVRHLKDRGQFLLVSRGFHWISETTFNR